MNPSIDDHLAAAHEMIDGRDAEIEQLKETIRAFGRGDIVPITDKDAEIERLRAALAQCAAEYQTPPGTVMGCAAHVAAEFRRRMDIAGDALAFEQQEPKPEVK